MIQIRSSARWKAVAREKTRQGVCPEIMLNYGGSGGSLPFAATFRSGPGERGGSECSAPCAAPGSSAPGEWGVACCDCRPIQKILTKKPAADFPARALKC